ncbi:MAG TPA: putative sulfate exporter family transporter, partial [Burkholderiales bacterium]|nr:putative sulfate exporter family transporter [Burkholderiales bacterium]
MAAKSWRTEDWVAVYLGFFVIAVVLAAFSWKWFDLGVASSTFRWTADAQIAGSTPGWRAALDDVAKEARAKGRKELAARAGGLKAALDKGERKGIEKAAGDLSKAGGRNTVAGTLGSEMRGHVAATADKVFSAGNLGKVLTVGIALLVIGAAGFALIGGNVGAFLIGFPAVFVLAWLARVIAGNGLFIDYGVEYVIFALVMGLLVSNTIGTPKWLRAAVQTEYFIKTGLVILGAGLLFLEVIQAGVLGILQAVLVVFVIWYVCFWFARKLRVD